MALLSVIVPIHGVQGYLRQCLDSILDQSFTDIEVIAVNDQSPDSSGEILAEYASREPRLRVVTPPQNVGLGESRNLGLAEATGRYVWFVDGDDSLRPGCLAAVARRLAQTEPDMLIVDYVRVHWNNRVWQSKFGTRLLREAPETFTLAEWPDAVRLLHTAWNRVLRRDFLLASGVRFQPPRWYEDVSWTYPLLMRASRMSTLPVVCVNYRQRRHGAITQTVGERHFDVFAQWGRVFAFVDENPEYDQFRPAMFNRMNWHFRSVLRHSSRIPRRMRSAFFAQITENYRRFRPAGMELPRGRGDAVRYRLVAQGHYRTFRVLRTVARAMARVRRTMRTARRTAGSLKRRLRTGVQRAYYQIQLRLPLDGSLAVYAAYWYRGYACNPAAIYEKARELAPGVRGVWVVDGNRASSMPAGVPYVVAGSFAYHRVLARAGYLINNVNYPNFMVKRRGSVHVMTHHGTPLKVMGVDQQDYPTTSTMDFVALLRRCDRWDYSISANTFSSQVWDRAYPCGYRHLVVGYPRNDRLAVATGEQVAAARAAVGVEPGQLVVLYLPTHRDYATSFTHLLDVDELASVLGPAGAVLVRAHYFYEDAGVASGGRVRDVTDHPSVEELYLAADVLITDYSSAIFDYAVLDRPIVIFAPDWEVYRATRGVMFDLLAEAPGPVATKQEELLALFRDGGYTGDALDKMRARFRQRFCSLEDGRASERVVRALWT